MTEKHDPVQCTPKFKLVIAEVEKKVAREMKKRGYPPKATLIGWCHLYWSVKKEVLKKDYSIDWKSPAEMNPQYSYD